MFVFVLFTRWLGAERCVNTEWSRLLCKNKYKCYFYTCNSIQSFVTIKYLKDSVRGLVCTAVCWLAGAGRRATRIYYREGLLQCSLLPAVQVNYKQIPANSCDSPTLRAFHCSVVDLVFFYSVYIYCS